MPSPSIKSVKKRLEDELSAYAKESGYSEKIRKTEPDIIQRDYWKDKNEVRYILIKISPNEKEKGRFYLKFDQLPPEEKTGKSGTEIYDEVLWRFRSAQFFERLLGPVED